MTIIALPSPQITHSESKMKTQKELKLGSSLTFAEVLWNTLWTSAQSIAVVSLVSTPSLSTTNATLKMVHLMENLVAQALTL